MMSIIHRFRSGLRHVTSVCLILALTLPTQAQNDPAKPPRVKLVRGQVLELELVTPLDSGTANIGDDILLKLSRSLTAEDTTILPINSIVHGQITNVRRASRNCKPGAIAWKLAPIAMTDGKRVTIQKIDEYRVMQGGAVADRIRLEPAGKKIIKGLEYTAVAPLMAPFLALAAPLFLFAIIGTQGERTCLAEGQEKMIQEGTEFYAAVSKDAVVTPLR